MKILNLMPYAPVPPDFGGALREYYLLKSLASRHQVTVLTWGDAEQERMFREEFGEQVNEIHMVRPPLKRRFRRLGQLWSLCTGRSHFFEHNCGARMQRAIDRLLARERFDAVHCEFSVMANHRFGDVPLKVTDTHNVEYENFRRMWEKTDSLVRRWYYRREYRKVYGEEIEALRGQDMIFCTSPEDRCIISEEVEGVPKVVIPNGVDTSFFAPAGEEEPVPCSMVFTGMMAYTPNYDGMAWFLDEVFPLIRREEPRARITIVGKRPPKLLRDRAGEGVEITGYVDDVRPYVHRSQVFVVPLRMGSGTRLKVMEALSMRRPVVSTRIGCEGIEVEDGKSILVEDNPAEFARAVVRLFRDPVLRGDLTREGAEVVHRKYDWSVVGRRMLEAYDRLAGVREPEERKPSSRGAIGFA